MLLLHISDIHFNYPVCGTQMDPDRPYRTILLQDARDRAASLGPVDAILVSGDIAFHGMAEEYSAASEWLADLASACGCQIERVYVVPGNHDVDRNVITGQASVRNAQQAIGRAAPDRRERELLVQFQDGEAGRSLFAPLGAYNEFAARFSCQVYPPERLFWQQDLEVDEKTVIRIHGLTSTLLSGAGVPSGRDDSRESLYLSPLQTALDPLDGVVNLVLCHHPPDWFMDADVAEDAICGRAAIHLFGHKHRQRFSRDENYVRFSAGAVNPNRYEVGWEPGYNIIRLTVSERAGARYLDVEAQLLVWQARPDMFRPKMVNQTDVVFRHTLPIRGVVATARLPASRGNTSAADGPRASNPVEAAGDTEAAMSNVHARNLVFRFWSLASSKRREIAEGLRLIEPAEIALPETERYGRALMRASERGLLEQLAEEIDRMENR